jgi:tRNA(Ile)-lysidine synthase
MNQTASIKKDPFFDLFTSFLSTFDDLKPRKKILVAVSGGLDSIALLHLLHAYNKYDLYIAHVNHKIRPDSDKDQKFVEKVAFDSKIPIFTKILDFSSKKKSSSLEEWGREMRYSFFNQIKNNNDLDFIMTAHHGNDQVETLLLNLSRKTGVKGLRGIAKNKNNLIRPMLVFSRKKISDFVNRNKIKFVEDYTNKDNSIPRNFIRAKVIQPWENQNQKIISSICSSIDYFNEWCQALDFLILKHILPNIYATKSEFRISITNIIEMPKIIQIRLIELLLKDSDNIKFSKHHHKMLFQFINKPKIGNFISISPNWELRHERKNLVGYRIKSKVSKVRNKVILESSIIAGEYSYELSFKEYKINKNLGLIKNLEVIDWSKIENKDIHIRLWEKGDSFIPLGMDGHQKVSDFLVNQKVENFQKKKQYVMTADNEIIWVCGLRISNTVKIMDSTVSKAYLIQKEID